jgi:hypothetical protein
MVAGALVADSDVCERLDRRGCCHLASGKLKEAVRKAAQLDQRTLSSLIERLLTEHCQQVGTLRRP